MPETSVIFVGGDGWTDMAPDLPEERTTTSAAFQKPWWQGVKIYHRNGYVYEVEKAEPEDDVPVIVTFTEAWPAATLGGAAAEGVAGGGASSLAALQPYVFVPLQYSWMVHIVMSSKGSRQVND